MAGDAAAQSIRPMPPIEIRNLTKRYGDTAVVDDLSFDVAAGSVTAFLGANGAGKTTTLRILLGLAEPTAGTATFDGRAYRDLPDPSRRVGAVLETTGFHPIRRAREHLRAVAVASGVSEARIDEALEHVGLRDAAGKRVKGFSLGMRQRLGLATALVGRPGVLILDEPANGLDPELLAGIVRSNEVAPTRTSGSLGTFQSCPPSRGSMDRDRDVLQ